MKAPTLEAVKAIAKTVYQKHTLGAAHRDSYEHFNKWMENRYDEFYKAISDAYEPVDHIYAETDDSNRSLDVVVMFFNMEKLTFEIDLVWGE